MMDPRKWQARWITALFAVLLCTAAGSARADAGAPHATLTIADGPVQVLRGGMSFDAGEGSALNAKDIVRTADATRVARLEFSDGQVLDLGAGTQVLLLEPPGASALVIQGWAKFIAPPSAGGSGLATSIVHVLTAPGGSVLLHVAAEGATWVFAESRSANVRVRPLHAANFAADGAALREGQVWLGGDAQSPGGVAPAAVAAARLRDVPRALTDVLPRRAERFVGRTIALADGQPLLATAAISARLPGARRTAWRTSRSRGVKPGLTALRATLPTRAPPLSSTALLSAEPVLLDVPPLR